MIYTILITQHLTVTCFPTYHQQHNSSRYRSRNIVPFILSTLVTVDSIKVTTVLANTVIVTPQESGSRTKYIDTDIVTVTVTIIVVETVV